MSREERIDWLRLMAAFVFVAMLLGMAYLSAPEKKTLVEKMQESVAIVETENGWGSAVAFQPNGAQGTFFLTAKHVVEGKADVKIRVESHTRGFKAGYFTVPAKVVFVSPGCDAAVLQIPPVKWGFSPAVLDQSPTRVGDEVYAVGNMDGVNFDGTVSQGIVAQIGVHPPDFATFPWALVDQTTAMNLPGSSGGPLFSKASGRVIGIQVGNYKGAAFFYLPSRVLMAHARNEGWAWLFGEGFVTEKQIAEMAPKIVKAVPPSLTPVIEIPDLLKLIPLSSPPKKGLSPELLKGHR